MSMFYIFAFWCPTHLEETKRDTEEDTGEPELVGEFVNPGSSAGLEVPEFDGIGLGCTSVPKCEIALQVQHTQTSASFVRYPK